MPLFPIIKSKLSFAEFKEEKDPKEIIIGNIKTAIRQGNVKKLLVALSKSLKFDIDHADIFNDLKYSIKPYQIKTPSDLRLAESLLSEIKSLLTLCVEVSNGLGD